MPSTKAITGFLFVAALAFGQFETSEVLGTVRDASQNPVANAAVTLTNEETGIAAKTSPAFYISFRSVTGASI